MYELRHDVRTEPFPVKMTIRSEKYRQLIQREKAKAAAASVDV
jgi:hypothetical protein